MKKEETYQPDWISEEEACKWLGVSKMTLYRWRTTHGLAYSKVNDRTLMYDRKQINKILNENSTYAYTHNIKLAV